MEECTLGRLAEPCCQFLTFFLGPLLFHFCQEICAGFEILEDTLVLRLEGGAEYYVPVSARYASQAFGTPLEQLSSQHGSQVLSPCPIVAPISYLEHAYT